MSAVIDGAWLLCLHMCLYVGVGWRVGYKTRKSHVKEKEEVGKRWISENREEPAGVEWTEDGEKKEEAKPNMFENAKMKSNVLYANFSKEGKNLLFVDNPA